MTVAQFQRIHEIIETTPDTVEQLGWMICEVFGKTHDQVDNMSAKTFEIYSARLTQKLAVRKPWLFPIAFQTDASKITFGQFVECQHWLKNPVQSVIDLVGASILVYRGDHREDAEWLRDQKLGRVLPYVHEFIESMNSLIDSYKGLFEQDTEDEEIRPMKKGPGTHPFVEQYGWIYSATEIAAHEGLKLDEVYDLPVIQALNDLSYLKAKQQYEKSIQK